MTLSAWADKYKVQERTCDHEGSTTVDDSNVASCSDCNVRWPVSMAAGVTTLSQQVQL